ncbi:DMT family transporter [Mesorhizobium sp. B1-1-5]|uniref:DMT family transporter n=1 Tax=Mesorhizobium sp. B1-1-5 TaxID=2589979 RepID=UPI001FEFBA73|nr:DMT family transporter [Mesorhizobium sp. B1-1-5]
MIFGISAGTILGFYDFWTKKAMHDNGVLPVVFWSALFGALAWLPSFLPVAQSVGMYVDLAKTSVAEQSLILVKSLAMTASWLLAYYSVRELPMSFSGAVRASGPLWTLLAGAIVFGEMLAPIQLVAVGSSVGAYYILSIAGRKEGIRVLSSRPVAMMVGATVLSAMTTVYDKFIVQSLGTPAYAVQAYSAIDRCILSLAVLLLATRTRPVRRSVRWDIYIPLVGLSWVAAELVYFYAIQDPAANVTYLSIFRRTSLVVGFLLSAALIGEKNVPAKSFVVAIIVLSTIMMVMSR